MVSQVKPPHPVGNQGSRGVGGGGGGWQKPCVRDYAEEEGGDESQDKYKSTLFRRGASCSSLLAAWALCLFAPLHQLRDHPRGYVSFLILHCHSLTSREIVLTHLASRSEWIYAVPEKFQFDFNLHNFGSDIRLLRHLDIQLYCHVW